MRAKFISNDRRAILLEDRNSPDDQYNAESLYHHPKIAKLFWKKFLIADELTDDDWDFATKMAGSWNTCACGSINDGLLRRWHTANSTSASPQDGRLHDLGMRFYHAIQHRRLTSAQELFITIQSRGHDVLEEQKKAAKEKS